MSCQIGKHFSSLKSKKCIICKAVWFIVRFFTMPFVKFNFIRFETCLFKTTLKCSSSKINDKIIILSRIILKSVYILLKELNILLAQIFLQRHLSWFLDKLGVIPRLIAHNFSFAKILVFCKSETHLLIYTNRIVRKCWRKSTFHPKHCHRTEELVNTDSLSQLS